MSAARHARDRAARAAAAAPRPAHDRAAAGRAVRAARAAALRVRGQPRDVPAHRRAAARALPVHRDVPRHVDRDAARAHHRHARAADDDAARPRSTCSPATGSRSARWRRVQAASCAPSGSSLLGLDAPHGAWLVAAARGRQRGARDGARAVRQRVRADRVPGRAVHAGGGPPAAPAVRAVRPARPDGRGAAGMSSLLPLTYAYDALAAGDAAGAARHWSAIDVAVVPARRSPRWLGALTLRRRTP